jgi:DNA-directed RNA polymerase specialized sigma24 family protein
METSAVNETGRETDFVSRIMAGDRQAEAELIDSYGRGVRIIIRRAGAGATIIDDLCQETFRIVLEKIESIRFRGGLFGRKISASVNCLDE